MSMTSNERDDKKQSEQPFENKNELFESEDDQYQEVLICDYDRRRRVDVFKPKLDDIYPCIGQLDVEYDYSKYHFKKSQIGSGTVIFVSRSNHENDEKEKPNAIILTCAHNVRLNVMQCDKCHNYRLKRDKTCVICTGHPSSKLITIKATKIIFRDRSIQHNNYGQTLNNYSSTEYFVPDNEYNTCPEPKGGFDWAFLRFPDKNGTYEKRLQNIHINLVNGLDAFNSEKKREYGIFGYPCDNNHKDIMLGMLSDNDNVNKFLVKSYAKTNMKYLQQTAIDTGYGQSGSLIWFKENNMINVCGIHCGGSQGSTTFSKPHNVATLLYGKIIDTFCSLTVKFLDQSCIITKEQELKLFKKMLWNQLNKSNNITLQLLYRSTEQDHQTDAASFHKKCDDKGTTITIIQSKYKHIFGGYTSISWSSPKNVKWISDQFAFLYLLKSPFNQLKIYPIDMNKGKAVAHNKLYGPCFGRRDIIIKGSESFCWSKGSYNISGNNLCGGKHALKPESPTKFAFKYECYEVYLLKNN